MDAHERLRSGNGHKCHPQAVGERLASFCLQRGMIRQGTGDILEIETLHRLGGKGGEVVMQLIDRGPSVSDSVDVAVAKEDHEGAREGINPEHLPSPTGVTVATDGEQGTAREAVVVRWRAIGGVDVPAESATYG